METKIIYTRRMALYLRDKGHKIIQTVPDDKMPHFYNWVFEKTPELEADINAYMVDYKKNHIK